MLMIMLCYDYVQINYVGFINIGNDFDADSVEMDGTRINRFIFEVMTKHQRCESIHTKVYLTSTPL